jgi:hypothetical protein
MERYGRRAAPARIWPLHAPDLVLVEPLCTSRLQTLRLVRYSGWYQQQPVPPYAEVSHESARRCYRHLRLCPRG